MGVNVWGASPLYMNPVNGLYIDTSTSRRQGRNREGPSEGSGRAKPTNPTNRNSIQGPSLRQVSTTGQSPGFGRYGKCCGCIVTVHVLIRETCPVCTSIGRGARHGNMPWDRTGVSRGHSRQRKQAQRNGENRERLTPPKGRTQRREEPL